MPPLFLLYDRVGLENKSKNCGNQYILYQILATHINPYATP